MCRIEAGDLLWFHENAFVIDKGFYCSALKKKIDIADIQTVIFLEISMQSLNPKPYEKHRIFFCLIITIFGETSFENFHETYFL